MQSKKCEVCGTEIVPVEWILKGKRRVHYNRFCSEKCKAKYYYVTRMDYYRKYWKAHNKGLSEITCQFCGKVVMARKSTTLTCSQRCARKLWKKKNWQKVLSDQRQWFKKKRKEQPERFRFYVKNRKHLIRESSGSTKRFSKAFTLQEWEAIKDKQGGKCIDCKLEKKLTIDHIKPLSKSGTHCKENIQGLCHGCNSRKKDRMISLSHIS